MGATDSWDSDSNHCGRAGCTCLHVYCDRGWSESSPRKVPVTGKDTPAVYDRVQPCPGCKPEAYDAMLRAANRRDWQRRLRSLRPEKP